HHLVSHENKFRNKAIVLKAHCKRRVERNPVHECLIKVTDNAAVAAAEAERIANEKPKDGGDAHRDKTLDHDAENVALVSQSSVKESETGRHHHHEGGSDEHEAGSTCVELWLHES